MLETARDLWRIRPDFVIDVGAAEGKWSGRCAAVWPSASYMLVEPLAEHAATLTALAAANGWRYEAFVAGERDGTVEFTITDDLDGSGVYSDQPGEKRKVDVRALDSVAPDGGRGLLKLDTHGYEVPILDGAARLLDRIDLAVIEVYGHRISDSCLLFHEICALMDSRGFRVAGIVDPMKRPGDQCFWQADFFFLRNDHPVFASNKYQPAGTG